MAAIKADSKGNRGTSEPPGPCPGPRLFIPVGIRVKRLPWLTGVVHADLRYADLRNRCITLSRRGFSLAESVQFREVVFAHPGYPPVLRGVTLDLPPGEALVLLGRSGCGKSTLMRLVNALAFPTSGEVKVGGRPTTGWDPILLRRRVGYVLQEAALFPHMSVRDNVAVVPRLLGWSEDRIRSRVPELLERTGLDPAEVLERMPRDLSGGQRQRVSIARALCADPPVLLLDEPFSALDPLVRRQLQLDFRRITRDLGKTIILVTHDVQEAVRLADQLALLHEGRLAYLGSPAGLPACEHPEARAFAEGLQPSVPGV